jgi:hypothetical protein
MIGKIVGHREVAARWSFVEITGRFGSAYTQNHRDAASVALIAKLDGSIDYAAFIGLLHAIGIDSVLFSVDYPYSDNRACKRFLENLPISPDDKEKVAHLNAERLLKFNPWSRR